jgi:eukaryotic translation initiation factor 2C
LQTFKEKNQGILPQRIFFFRDGVSEGEFAIVRDQELSAMKGSLFVSQTNDW